jgi:uncharacterized membrane protein YedE/YeeE
MNWLTLARWSPYAVGAGMGIVIYLGFLLSDRSLGCSTAFARAAGMIEGVFRGEKVKERPYFIKFAPVFGWGGMLVIGVIVGAFISSVLSGSFELKWVPDRWAEAFGPSPLLRVIGAFVGGILMGIGSRWAGGCTSGHGISGTLQLAISSWIAVIGFFAGGIATAMLLYNVLAGVL